MVTEVRVVVLYDLPAILVGDQKIDLGCICVDDRVVGGKLLPRDLAYELNAGRVLDDACVVVRSLVVRHIYGTHKVVILKVITIKFVDLDIAVRKYELHSAGHTLGDRVQRTNCVVFCDPEESKQGYHNSRKPQAIGRYVLFPLRDPLSANRIYERLYCVSKSRSAATHAFWLGCCWYNSVFINCLFHPLGS